MIKTIVFAMLNLFMMGSAFSQGKHSLSLGLGNEKVFNEMIIPYNFSGVNLSIDYNYENYMKRNWKTFFDINVAASPSLGLTQKFSNNTRFNSPVLSLDISVNKLYLKKLVEIRNFSFHAGIISSLQFNYQVTNSAILPNSTIDGSAFLRLDLAAGLSTSAQLKYKKFLFQNTASYLLLSASLYPNYSDDIPIFNDGRTKDYFTLSWINKRTHVTNKFRIEFPLYIKDRYINSFALTHNLRYEYSTIKDNRFYKLTNTFNIGVIFRIKKFYDL